MTDAADTSGKRSTRSQLYWNTLVRIPAQIINIIMSILIARLLMPKDFGIMGIVMMLIGYANLITNFGLAEAIIQKNIHDRKVLDSIFTFNFLTSSLLAGGFYAGAGFIAEFFQTPECESVIRVMSLVFIITSLPVIPGTMLRRDMNFKLAALFDLTGSILMSTITFMLAYRGFQYWALVYGQLIPLTAMSILLCIKVKYLPCIYFNQLLMKDVYNFGVWNFFRAQLSFMTQHVDRFIIGKFMGPVQLGYYDKSLTLASTPYNAITMNINSVMFSSFSIDKEDRQQLKNGFLNGIALIAFINFPICLGLIAIAPYFITGLLGNQWIPMIVPFQIILFSYMFKSFVGLIASLNVGIGKYKTHTMRTFCSFVLFAILCFLSRKYDVYMVAMCFSIFCIIEVILLIDLSCKLIQISLFDVFRSLFPAIVLSLVMFIVVILLSLLMLHEKSVVNMVILVTIGAMVYGFCILLSPNALCVELRDKCIKDIKAICARVWQ